MSEKKGKLYQLPVTYDLSNHIWTLALGMNLVLREQVAPEHQEATREVYAEAY
ncbi:MAG: hypothetical protein IBX71_09680, partial [Candidatus Desulforudis sp.]|nr:hypothetical protein [Desulforudis sp.]